MKNATEKNSEVFPELEQLIEELIGERKDEFFEQTGRQFPHTIRFNNLKGDINELAALLREQGFDFEPLPKFDNIFRIRYQPYPIGKSLSHFLGHFYVQDIASQIPPLVLDPRPGEWVLDMSAAPGSKTTQMAAQMENRGVLIANDVVMKRLQALTKNLQRMGVLNTAVFKWYGEQYGGNYFEKFDKILLDPACSGLGTLHKSPEVLNWWTPAHCQRLANQQRSLIASALKALRPGGVLVYSTCTLTPEENEEVVDFALENFPVFLEDIKLPGLKTRHGLQNFRNRSFHSDMKKAVRLYPFENDTEGFFIARLRKTESIRQSPTGQKTRTPRQMPLLSHNTSPVKKYLDYLAQHFQIPRDVFANYIYLFEKNIVVLSKDVAEFPFLAKPLYLGLQAGRTMDQGSKLNTEGCHLWGDWAQNNIIQMDDPELLERFINREAQEIPCDGKGQLLVKYKNHNIGYGICGNNKLKSQFPKADWPFEFKVVKKKVPEPSGRVDS